MSNTKLFIPTKIKVGFQERGDTFTKKLGYVIPLGEKGEYRKQGSWAGWRDHKIDPVEYDNTAVANFVLNKGVQRYGYWRGSGRSVVRIYDTRDFEFEITVDNLMFILMHSDVSKRDIMAECVYAWDKDKLILLPTNSQEYIESTNYTEKQFNKVSAKALVKGATYRTKKSDVALVYMGYFEWFDMVHEYGAGVAEFSDHTYGTTTQVSKGKKHVFCQPEHEKNGYVYQPTFVTPSISTLSHQEGDEIHPKFAEYSEKLFSTYYVVKIADIVFSVVFKPIDQNTGRLYVRHGDLYGEFYQSRYEVERANSGTPVSHSPRWHKSSRDTVGRFYTKNYTRNHSYTYYPDQRIKKDIGPNVVFQNGSFNQPVYTISYQLENGNIHHVN